MCCVSGNRHLQSVSVIGPLVVVLLSEMPRAAGFEVAGAALTAGSALPHPHRP